MQTAARINVYEYNAFTDESFGGNPAGVVTHASGLSDETMQKIARQLNLAETAFLLPPDDPTTADVRLRWFTPAREVDLCGHATIAAFTAAIEHDLFPIGGEKRVLTVETRSGPLRVRLSRIGDSPQVAMQIPQPSFTALELERESFARLWAVTPHDLPGDWLRHDALNYWYLPVRDRAALRRLTLDSASLAGIDPAAAFAFYTTDTVDSNSHWHMRFFAPFHGVDEDIVTGSAQGPMAVVYLLRNAGSEVVPDGWSEFRGEQGDSLDRPGRVRVRVLFEDGVLQDLEIVGSAVGMLEGTLRI